MLLDNKYNLYLDFSTNSHIMEITELKFFNLEELKVINTDKVLINLIKKMFKIAKPYFIN